MTAQTPIRGMPKTKPPPDWAAVVSSSTTRSGLRRAGADLLLLAGVLDVVDLAELLLMQLAVAALHDFDEILVHHDVAGGGIDRDRTARAVVFPVLQRGEGGVGVAELALGGFDHVRE